MSLDFPAMADGWVGIDESELPLLRVSYHGLLDKQGWEEHIDWLSKMLRRRVRFAAVVDARDTGLTPPVHRKLFADWLSHDSELVAQYCVGSGVALSTGLQRGLLTAVLWFVPTPAPLEVFKTVEDAERFARGLLRDAD